MFPMPFTLLLVGVGLLVLHSLICFSWNIEPSYKLDAKETSVQVFPFQTW